MTAHIPTAPGDPQRGLLEHCLEFAWTMDKTGINAALPMLWRGLLVAHELVTLDTTGLCAPASYADVVLYEMAIELLEERL